jgi:hypothetical protein
MKKKENENLCLISHVQSRKQEKCELLESRDNKFDEEDHRCDRSAIDHHSTINESRLAAEEVNLNSIQIRRQKRIVERNPI